VNGAGAWHSKHDNVESPRMSEERDEILRTTQLTADCHAAALACVDEEELLLRARAGTRQDVESGRGTSLG
jgi:hypothetical protein